MYLSLVDGEAAHRLSWVTGVLGEARIDAVLHLLQVNLNGVHYVREVGGTDGILSNRKAAILRVAPVSVMVANWVFAARETSPADCTCTQSLVFLRYLQRKIFAACDAQGEPEKLDLGRVQTADARRCLRGQAMNKVLAFQVRVQRVERTMPLGLVVELREPSRPPDASDHPKDRRVALRK